MANDILIRTMQLQHVIDMNKKFVQSMHDDYVYFPTSYKSYLIRKHSLPQLIRSILSPKSCILLAYNTQSSLRGYCVMRLERSEPSTLLWIYVDQSARGSGIGKILVRAALERAKDYGSPGMQLLTHDRDDFFAQQGFERTHRISGMLAGVDMSIMKAVL